MIIDIVVSPADHRDTFAARLKGQDAVLCRSRQPIFDAARVLLSDGRAHPDDTLVMRHEGSDVVSFNAQVGNAAKLTVSELKDGNGPRFVRWRPFPSYAVGPRTAKSDPLATQVAQTTERPSLGHPLRLIEDMP